jgi:glycosyltransferase involved in cell wall biosynthesis
VIASNIPGVRTVVDDGKTGVLVPPGDVEALAAALTRLATMSDDERRALGTAARQAASDRYAWPRVIDKLETVYAAATRTTTGSSSSAA